MGSFEIWKRALHNWTAPSSLHLTLPVREVVGAVYDRAFSCRTEDVLHKGMKEETRGHRPRLQPPAPAESIVYGIASAEEGQWLFFQKTHYPTRKP